MTPQDLSAALSELCVDALDKLMRDQDFNQPPDLNLFLAGYPESTVRACENEIARARHNLKMVFRTAFSVKVERARERFERTLQKALGG